MCEKFDFGVQKIQRGQVWFVDEPDIVTKVLRENNCKALNGTRPYFIVNVNGSMVNCVPMTTNTIGSDTRADDIIFLNPINNTESRIVISQITTKGSLEFTKYFYSFDDESVNKIIDKIKTSLFGEKDTCLKPRLIEKEEPKEVEAIETLDSTVKLKNVLPDEIKQFEMRLVSYFKLSASKRKAESMFRTQREALIFMSEYCDRPSEELCKIFGIDKPTVYRMRSKAKEAAYRK